MRKICVITGTRAEYGILKPLLREIEKSKKLKLILAVAGMHLLKNHGSSFKEIQEEGFKIKKIPMYSEKSKDLSEALSLGIKNFSRLLKKEKPDMLVIFGDRLEPLAATLVASISNIPIAHISGGDKTDSGIIDESIRHSLTKFAHIHFPETKSSAKRIEKMGEEKWRIYFPGALEIDAILQREKVNKERLFKKYNLNPNKKLIICIQHSFNIEWKKAGIQMKETISALKDLEIQSLIIYPNNDKGSEQIIEELRKINEPLIKVERNVKHSDYINLLSYASVMIGNSSSGIVESPSLKLPVVNIGRRNTGREHSKNIIFVNHNKKEIIGAIKKSIYNRNYVKKVKKVKSAYGGGDSAIKIIKVLENIPINKKLLSKKVTY
jgi:GDP/UDP-N,N'-diacetylbacillosamine 2-epimerase (hydrolysing)